MNGIEKIIEYISAESSAECKEIAFKAVAECEQIRSEYSRLEQDEYWKAINAGSKEAELRLEQLNNLAACEAKKLVVAAQQEMLDRAFELAAKKLRNLPGDTFKEIISRPGVPEERSVEALVEHYKEELSPLVLSILFDSTT